MSDPFHYRDGKLYCEAVSAEEIVAHHGTPLYVYSRASIERRYRELDEAFSAVDRLIAYSVKANGNLSILRLLSRAGAGADIVSGGELHRARLAGVPAEKIVFSGVGKTVTELAASSVNLALRFWLKNPHHEVPLEFEYLERLKGALDDAGIGIPYPHVSLRVERMPEVRLSRPPETGSGPRGDGS